MRKLERSLTPSHSCVTLLREYMSTDINRLRTLWSKVPLKLKCLHLQPEWFRPEFEVEIVMCLTSKHQDTQVGKLIVSGGIVGDQQLRYFFSLIHTFHSLKWLSIEVLYIPYSRMKPDEVIASLDCPTLTILELEQSWAIPALGDTLPSLETLKVSRHQDDASLLSYEESIYYSSYEKWTRLQNLMKRGINFTNSEVVFLSDEVALLPFVFVYAQSRRLDYTPIATWLLCSQALLDEQVPHSLNVSRFISSHRDETLRLYKSLNIVDDLHLHVRLQSGDSPALVDYLPSTVVSLDLTITEFVSPPIIPALIRNLPNLEEISIRLFVGRSSASCTYSPFHVLPPIGWRDRQWKARYEACDAYEYRFHGQRGDRFIWEMADEKDVDTREPCYQIVDVTLPSLEAEVEAWFEESPVLQYIEVIFDWDEDCQIYFNDSISQDAYI